VKSGDVAIQVKLGPPSSWKRPFQMPNKFNSENLEASVAVGKKGKAFFRWLIEAAICLVLNSTG
jgi:hypothetical protein